VSVARAILRFARGEVVFKQLLSRRHGFLRQWRPVTQLQTYAKEAGLLPVTLAPAESISYRNDTIRSQEELSRLSLAPQQLTFPEIYTVSIADAHVVPASNFIATKTHLICHDLMDPLHQKPPEELTGYFRLTKSRNEARIMPSFQTHDDLEEAAHFLDGAAQNYAHWMTEILPRIVLFCKNPSFANIPLLVDDNLPASVMESLLLAAGENRKIFIISRGIAVKVKTLHMVSVTGYVPFEFCDTPDQVLLHGQFSPTALKAVRHLAAKTLEENNSPIELPRKFFVQRNSPHRVLLNQDAIKNFCIDNSFECVAPEFFSFAEQVRLFANADEIVGPTGAAFANIIFCQPSCKITILICEHPQTPYGYWINIAAAVGARVRYVLGQSNAPIAAGIHRNFSIPPASFPSLIEHE